MYSNVNKFDKLKQKLNKITDLNCKFALTITILDPLEYQFVRYNTNTNFTNYFKTFLKQSFIVKKKLVKFMERRSPYEKKAI